MDDLRRQREVMRLRIQKAVGEAGVDLGMYEGPQSMLEAAKQLEAVTLRLRSLLPAEGQDLLKTQLRVLVLAPQRSLWQSFLTSYLQSLWQTPGPSAVCSALLLCGFEDLVIETSQEFIRRCISEEVKERAGKLDEEALGPLEDWAKSRLLPWLSSLCIPLHDFSVFPEVARHLASTRIAQIYDITLDFPASQPALSDLGTCLRRERDLIPVLEAQLVKEMSSRAIAPCKPTEGILLLYINLSKTLKNLFTTIEVLEAAAEPLKKALRARPDTFRCIIQSIAEDLELYQMLDIKQKNVKELDEFSSEEDEAAAAEWQPIPRSAVRSAISALNKRSDLVSMLVNIYGSPEQFMDDYRAFLGQKLVEARDFQASAELKDLEMLKKRFGEANVHKCEVMLQDVANSKRINSFIHESPGNPLNCLVISSYFWPIEEVEGHFKLPLHLQKVFEWYSQRYTIAKASRKLKFHEMMGKATVTLEFENGSKTWTDVAPLHAAIISLFHDSDTRKSAEEMASSLSISPGLLRKEIAVWEARGVLVKEKEGEEVFYTAVQRLV